MQKEKAFASIKGEILIFERISPLPYSQYDVMGTTFNQKMVLSSILLACRVVPLYTPDKM